MTHPSISRMSTLNWIVPLSACCGIHSRSTIREISGASTNSRGLRQYFWGRAPIRASLGPRGVPPARLLTSRITLAPYSKFICIIARHFVITFVKCDFHIDAADARAPRGSQLSQSSLTAPGQGRTRLLIQSSWNPKLNFRELSFFFDLFFRLVFRTQTFEIWSGVAGLFPAARCHSSTIPLQPRRSLIRDSHP